MLFSRMLIPSVLDILTGICASFAMTLAPPSLLEVLTCTSIIFNPIWAFLLMNKKYTIS
jgi:hypothetical protein